ncbi:hypothetical protein NW759_014617 [Fusarium solani]|nr:hypothetical protein NW759_014617 [Fusarium solani]
MALLVMLAAPRLTPFPGFPDCYGIDLGFGRHYWTISVEDSRTILQIFYASQILYIFVQVSVKGSILAFYWRIFPNRHFQIAVRVAAAFLFVHNIIFLGLVIFQCHPLQFIWDRQLKGTCLDLTAIGYAGAASNIIEDIGLFIMPIPVLLKLQLGVRKRLGLFVLFSLGSL